VALEMTIHRLPPSGEQPGRAPFDSCCATSLPARGQCATHASPPFRLRGQQYHLPTTPTLLERRHCHRVGKFPVRKAWNNASGPEIGIIFHSRGYDSSMALAVCPAWWLRRR